MPARNLAGIVALDGTLSAKQIKALGDATEEKILNFGCSVLGNSFFRPPDLHPWEPAVAPHAFEHSKDDHGLVNFCMNLVAELQRVGTVVATDTNAYLK